MANQPRGRRPSPPAQPEPSVLPAPPVHPDPPVFREPEVRRWPHPIDSGEPAKLDLPAALHFLHCSLSYQNQLLSEIRALLETRSGEEWESPEGK